MKTAVTPGREAPRTPISPVASREDLIAMIHNRDALVSDLKEALASARLAAKPSDEGCQKALRRLAIVPRHRMAYGGGTVHVGWACKTCGNDWDRDEPEKHKPECLAALSTGNPKP